MMEHGARSRLTKRGYDSTNCLATNVLVGKNKLEYHSKEMGQRALNDSGKHKGTINKKQLETTSKKVKVKTDDAGANRDKGVHTMRMSSIMKRTKNRNISDIVKHSKKSDAASNLQEEVMDKEVDQKTPDYDTMPDLSRLDPSVAETILMALTKYVQEHRHQDRGHQARGQGHQVHGQGHQAQGQGHQAQGQAQGDDGRSKEHGSQNKDYADRGGCRELGHQCRDQRHHRRCGFKDYVYEGENQELCDQDRGEQQCHEGHVTEHGTQTRGQTHRRIRHGDCSAQPMEETGDEGERLREEISEVGSRNAVDHLDYLDHSSFSLSDEDKLALLAGNITSSMISDRSQEMPTESSRQCIRHNSQTVNFDVFSVPNCTEDSKQRHVVESSDAISSQSDTNIEPVFFRLKPYSNVYTQRVMNSKLDKQNKGPTRCITKEPKAIRPESYGGLQEIGMHKQSKELKPTVPELRDFFEAYCLPNATDKETYGKLNPSHKSSDQITIPDSLKMTNHISLRSHAEASAVEEIQSDQSFSSELKLDSDQRLFVIGSLAQKKLHSSRELFGYGKKKDTNVAISNIKDNNCHPSFKIKRKIVSDNRSKLKTERGVYPKHENYDSYNTQDCTVNDEASEGFQTKNATSFREAKRADIHRQTSPNLRFKEEPSSVNDTNVNIRQSFSSLNKNISLSTMPVAVRIPSKFSYDIGDVQHSTSPNDRQNSWLPRSKQKDPHVLFTVEEEVSCEEVSRMLADIETNPRRSSYISRTNQQEMKTRNRRTKKEEDSFLDYASVDSSFKDGVSQFPKSQSQLSPKVSSRSQHEASMKTSNYLPVTRSSFYEYLSKYEKELPILCKDRRELYSSSCERLRHTGSAVGQVWRGMWRTVTEDLIPLPEEWRDSKVMIATLSIVFLWVVLLIILNPEEHSELPKSLRKPRRVR